MKTRKQLELEYESKYNEIPRDYQERLAWMYDKYHITEAKGEEILTKYYNMMNALYYQTIHIVLYEEPRGKERHRYRYVSRNNLIQEAVSNPGYVQVYSISGAQDQKYMKRLIEQELVDLQHLIYTPCDLVYTTFQKTPSKFNSVDTYLAELGLIRPIEKPDWDNIGKKYSDMSNSNLWLDDRLVIRGIVDKYYSILPRVEIELNYLNMVYTKSQAESISKSYDGEVEYFN